MLAKRPEARHRNLCLFLASQGPRKIGRPNARNSPKLPREPIPLSHSGKREYRSSTQAGDGGVPKGGFSVKRALVTLLSVFVGVAIVAGIAVFNSVREAEPPTLKAEPAGTMQTPQGELPHATLELAVYPNSSASVPPPKTSSNFEAKPTGYPVSPSTGPRPASRFRRTPL